VDIFFITTVVIRPDYKPQQNDYHIDLLFAFYLIDLKIKKLSKNIMKVLKLVLLYPPGETDEPDQRRDVKG